MGPSGSGKTTLLSLLGALDHPSEGQVLLDGKVLTAFSDIALARVRRRIAFVFQDFALIPRLPLWENVTYPLVPRGVSSLERLRRAEAALERVGLSGFEGRRPEELSGGERQRTAIARALATEPEAVIADEPTASLDPESAAAVRGALLGLRSAGATVLVATHDPALISIADLRFALRAGALAEDA
jgi:putative ABC transport system ATP-binding protein